MVFVNNEILRWVRLCCLVSLTWACMASLLTRAAEARSGKVVLAVTGDERMSSDLKELAEDFEKQQPLEGDALGVLQGAQAVASRLNTALRSRGYYDATLNATIDNRPIADASALEALEFEAGY